MYKNAASERAAKWNRENPDRRRATITRYGLRHLDELRARSALWGREHRESRRINLQKWQKKNPDRMYASSRRWILAHPEKAREYGARNYARRKRNTTGRHSAQEWIEKCSLFANLCAYCGEAKPLTRDHNIPLIRGGSDDISNIIPACKSCNCSKRSKTAAEFLAVRRRQVG